MKRDEYYMKKAIELARKGRGYTGNNPLVGAVVVKNEKIVGTGYHREYGGPHAEVFALQEAGDEAKGAELYVNLEPCCHRGKTGACSTKVINSGIDRLIVGMKDPNPQVAGQGLKQIADRGITVKTGVLEEKCRQLNEIFIKYMTTDFPFVILKAAQTMDGYLATSTGDSRWITGTKAREYGHRLRHRTEAILVGIGTVKSDNPRLTTRLEDKEGQDGLRIILDPKLEISPTARVFNQSSPAKTLLVCEPEAEEEKKNSLRQKDGVEIMELDLVEEEKLDLSILLNKLHQRGISSILVEGGGQINYSFLNNELIDKFYIFIAPRIYGGQDGVSVFSGSGPLKMDGVKELEDFEVQKVGSDLLIKGYI